ncbi:hypothetical protein QN345_03525 [Cryobacterium sp. 10I1]|uniref:hypothetical protein n=1 Tax=unclassified Cryobacterium TaxID=2649013 RepID=UPI002AB3324B|nr:MULTISPECIES: hypothetical protein [unclassified Cryobacterium]MDY7540862.1 hypothetical protein [Cryobacterium sp. 5B3]MEA9999826.1 hypothetical protein [Cryobacterium sp. RTS3]MEB0201288.1 hypothetical protein [Cryobacterium sp. 5I3]MEB0266613.1 hypothetical protein [Cryobacterium sp. 10I5]MEB0275389.1 hypothetical protein [Cryobacterium sp. 5B3]
MTFNESLHPRDTGRFTTKDDPAPDVAVSAPQATAHTLSDLMSLDDDDRAWLTEKLANGGTVSTQVSCELVSFTEEDEYGFSEVIGTAPVGDLYIRVFRGNDDLGYIELPGDWPADEFGPEGRGRGPDGLVNGRDYSDSLDFAVASAAADAGFNLDNSRVDDGSADGHFVRVFNLSLQPQNFRPPGPAQKRALHIMNNFNESLKPRDAGKCTTKVGSAPDSRLVTLHAAKEARLVAALAEAGGQINVDEIRVIRQAYVDQHGSEPSDWGSNPTFNALSDRWCLSAELYAARASADGFEVSVEADSGQRIVVQVINPDGETYQDICETTIPAGHVSGMLDYKPIVDSAVAVNKRAYAGEFKSIEKAFIKRIRAEHAEAVAAYAVSTEALCALLDARCAADGRWIPDEAKAKAGKAFAQAVKERLVGDNGRVEFVFLNRETTK